MIDLSSQWGLLTIIGPVILIVALIWAIRRNKGTPREIAHTEEATRRNYDRQNAEDSVRNSQ